MIYRTNPRNGDQLSQLAFGCMRFARSDADVARQLDYAIEHGVNYLDTAYVYSGSEVRLGKYLVASGNRDRINLATKLPLHMVKQPEDFDRLFGEQLERLQTDRIDYYLMHAIGEVATWRRLVDLGVREWIAAKKASGAIRNLGFSFHGDGAQFLALLDEFDWDFCMIQYSYLDIDSQAGTVGLRAAAAKKMAVMVMEPLRGGKLAIGLPKSAQALFRAQNPDYSFVDWALRWVWNHPEVTTALSGMGAMSEVVQNVAIASDAQVGALSEQQLQLVAKVHQIVDESILVGCTGCNYCMPCPRGVDIPGCFRAYNDSVSSGRMLAVKRYIMRTRDGGASDCVGCGKCQKLCPQRLDIRADLQRVRAHLEPWYYRPWKFFLRRKF